eukprot:7675839-Alexandrium_andersonii.AAC.1
MRPPIFPAADVGDLMSRFIRATQKKPQAPPYCLQAPACCLRALAPTLRAARLTRGLQSNLEGAVSDTGRSAGLQQPLVEVYDVGPPNPIPWQGDRIFK